MTVKCCAEGCGKSAADVARESETYGQQPIRSLLLCSRCRVAKYCSKVS